MYATIKKKAATSRDTTSVCKGWRDVENRELLRLAPFFLVFPAATGVTYHYHHTSAPWIIRNPISKLRGSTPSIVAAVSLIDLNYCWNDGTKRPKKNTCDHSIWWWADTICYSEEDKMLPPLWMTEICIQYWMVDMHAASA